MKIFFVLSMAFINLMIVTKSNARVISIEGAENNNQIELEEVIVTAQKRQQLLQDVPIAISTLNSTQLNILGIKSFIDLRGSIPSLKIMPLGNTPSNLVIAIRGNSPLDPGEITRDGSVAVYIDDVYLSRPHALGLELADLERMEVLSGPQGTLFGRNSIGGAVNVISKKPTGALGFDQTFTIGRFEQYRSVSRLNLPKVGDVSVKLNYLYSERNGWVENTAPNQSDYNEYKKWGVQLFAHWQINEQLEASYIYDQSDVETAQIYFQFYQDNFGVFGNERDRMRKTRLPVTPLTPTISEQTGHSVRLDWLLSENLRVKSISAYRELDENSNNNYAGVLYFNGLNDASTLNHYQLSQEIQFIVSHSKLDWVNGIYYLKEDANKRVNDTFTLDIFGLINGQPLTPIIPPTTFNVFRGENVPERIVDSQAKSYAIYSQATWNFTDRWYLTLGARYTDDQRDALRTEDGTNVAKQDSENIDTKFALKYDWNEYVIAYLSYSSAYKAGGVNTRSDSFRPFEEEEAKTYEIGIKSELWDKRLRINSAFFLTDYDGAQLDFVDPGDPTIVETINAANAVEINGIELDMTVIPSKGLILGFKYNYLDPDMPLQPNPLDNNALKVFHVAFAPTHAGSFTLDYELGSIRLGDLSAHMDITSTDNYPYGPFGEQRRDGYKIVNARLTLSNTKLGHGSLTTSLWAKNVLDEEYIINAFPVGDPPASIGQAFGDPRTIGIDVNYSIN